MERWHIVTGMVLAGLALSGCGPSNSPATGALPAAGDSAGAAPGSPAAQRPPAPGAPKPISSDGGGFFSRPKELVVPEGTVLKVRTTNTLSTKTNQAGEAFTASLEEPLISGDKVIARKGATVRGVIAEADPGGRVKGVAHLAVRLASLETADGKTVSLSTNTVGRQAQATKRKDAAKIGIGSGVGAVIGAIAGGGKGAAIGAAAGAGAGTGVVLATHGDAAVLPAESVLQFRLTAPFTVLSK
jgi:hypothetical protein